MHIIRLKDNSTPYSRFAAQLNLYMSGLSKGTIKNYHDTLSKWADFCQSTGNVYINFEPAVIVKFIDSLSHLAHGSRDNHLAIMKVMIDVIVASEPTNPLYLKWKAYKDLHLTTSRVLKDIPNEVKRPRLTLENVRDYLDIVLVDKSELSNLERVLLARDKVIIALLFFNGFRIGETSTLKWSDIATNTLRVTNHKGKRIENVPIFWSKRYIDEYKTTLLSYFDVLGSYVLIGLHSKGFKIRTIDKPLSVQPVHSVIEKMRDYFGVELISHSGRYTLALEIYKQTKDILRHKNIQITQLYIQEMIDESHHGTLLEIFGNNE